MSNPTTHEMILSRSLDTIEGWYRVGVLSQDIYEAYRWLHAVSAPRFGRTEYWSKPPTDQPVIEEARSFLIAMTSGEIRYPGHFRTACEAVGLPIQEEWNL